ncbi:hypothetical protein Tco_0349118 [Tanacetum coccineum]
MLRKKPNKVYDPYLKAGLGYQNSERLKKSIAAHPKMYDGERLQSTKLIIDSPDSEETLEDTEESFTKEVQEMLDIFESIEKKVEKQLQKDKKIQNEIDRLLEVSLSREIRDYVLISVEKQKNEMLMLEKEKISSDSDNVQANLLKESRFLKMTLKDLKLKVLILN